MANIMSGIGSERDIALREAPRGAVRQNVRTFCLSLGQERSILRLDPAVSHAALLVGDLVSARNGCVVPLNPSLPFAGIIEGIGEGRGRYEAGLIVRGALLVRVAGLSEQTQTRAKVYALPGRPSEVLTLDATGVLFGELLAVESLERGLAIVGFKLASDMRPLELGGRRPNREWR